MKARATKTLFFVMVLPVAVAGCSRDKPAVSATLNQSASLGGELPANPLHWRVITSGVSTVNSTMFTLYGNDVAIDYARTNSQHDYPNGSAISLVTWTQREDGRWFGAKIPNQVKSVEFVFIDRALDGRPRYSYQSFEGTPLRRMAAEEEQVPTGRVAQLLSQRAAVMP